MRTETHRQYQKDTTNMVRSLNEDRTAKACDLVRQLYNEEIVYQRERDNILAMRHIDNINDESEKRKKAHVEIKSLMELACAKTGVPIDIVRSQTRQRDVVSVRHCLAYVIRNKWGLILLKEIGVLINPAHPLSHSSIIHAIDRFKGLLDVKDVYAVETYAIVNDALKELFNPKSHESK